MTCIIQVDPTAYSKRRRFIAIWGLKVKRFGTRRACELWFRDLLIQEVINRFKIEQAAPKVIATNARANADNSLTIDLEFIPAKSAIDVSLKPFIEVDQT